MLFKITFLILIIGALGYSSTAYASDYIINVNPTKTSYLSGEYPVILGSIKDSAGNPVGNALIEADLFGSPISTTSNLGGFFSLKSSKPIEAGTHQTIVKISNENFTKTIPVSISADLNIIPILPQQIASDFHDNVASLPQTISSIPVTVTNVFTSDQFDNIISNMESQKANPNPQKPTSKFDVIRNEAKKDLQEDLEAMEKEYDYYSPENSFARFVQDVDSSVRNIFWGQFYLTQDLTEQGKIAKNQAIDEGKSNKEAMDAFNQKAAITRKNIIQHNEELNIKYGHSNSTIQNQFNDDGKINRED